jgi:hypothetical protein
MEALPLRGTADVTESELPDAAVVNARLHFYADHHAFL